MALLGFRLHFCRMACSAVQNSLKKQHSPNLNKTGGGAEISHIYRKVYEVASDVMPMVEALWSENEKGFYYCMIFKFAKKQHYGIEIILV